MSETIREKYNAFFIQYERMDKSKGCKVKTDYMLVPGRVKWFRDENGTSGAIETSFSTVGEYTIATARISINGQVVATGSATMASFNGRDIEKTETAAVGRALAFAGYGTQFSGDDINDEDYLSDSPQDSNQYLSNQTVAAQRYRKWTVKDGLSQSDVMSALGIKDSLSEYTGTVTEADTAIKTYIDSKLAPDASEQATPSPDEDADPKAPALTSGKAQPSPASSPFGAGRKFSTGGVPDYMDPDIFTDDRLAMAQRGEVVPLVAIKGRSSQYDRAWDCFVVNNDGYEKTQYVAFEEVISQLRMDSQTFDRAMQDPQYPIVFPEDNRPQVQLGTRKKGKPGEYAVIHKVIDATPSLTFANSEFKLQSSAAQIAANKHARGGA